jgi:hypothetical protein
MMSTLVWTAVAVGGMVGLFAACLVVVVVGVRVLEGAIAKRGRGPSA